jgi:hypothetical protein
MLRSASIPALPDLFDNRPAAPDPRTQSPTPQVQAPLPELSRISNNRLAQHLVKVTRELQQRKAGRAGRSNWSEVDRALQEALPALEALVPKRAGRVKQSAAAAAPVLQQAKRKAIRTALQAGVSPGQVAKHFGLSLAAVREVLAQATRLGES